LSENILETIHFLLLLLPFILIIGSFVEIQWQSQAQYLLLRSRNVALNFHALMFSIFMLIVSTVIMSYLFAFILLPLLPQTNPFDWTEQLPRFYSDSVANLLTNQLILLTGTIFFAVLTQVALLIITNNSAISSLITFFLAIASVWTPFKNSNTLIFFPWSYGQLSLQEIGSYSLPITYLHLLIAISLLYFTAFKLFLMRREQLFTNID
jgi:hypothetical protein